MSSDCLLLCFCSSAMSDLIAAKEIAPSEDILREMQVLKVHKILKFSIL